MYLERTIYPVVWTGRFSFCSGCALGIAYVYFLSPCDATHKAVISFFKLTELLSNMESRCRMDARHAGQAPKMRKRNWTENCSRSTELLKNAKCQLLGKALPRNSNTDGGRLCFSSMEYGNFHGRKEMTMVVFYLLWFGYSLYRIFRSYAAILSLKLDFFLSFFSHERERECVCVWKREKRKRESMENCLIHTYSA